METIKDLLNIFDLAGSVAELKELTREYAELVKSRCASSACVQRAQDEVNAANAALYIQPLTGKNEQERKGEIESRRQQSQRCIDAEAELTRAKAEDSFIAANIEAVRMQMRALEVKASLLASVSHLFGPSEVDAENTTRL